MAPITIARWLHVLTAAAWLGEVVTVVFVLAPIALRLNGPDRTRFISKVFPRVFQVATVLAIVTLAAGAWLNYLITGWRDLSAYFSSNRGVAILIGGFLGLLLALFHFVVEGRLEPRLRSLSESTDDAQGSRLMRFLTIVPRIGLAVIIMIFLFMMIGSRGF
jgi:putative copper export protein